MSKVKALDGVVTCRDSVVLMDKETGEVLDMSTNKTIRYKTGAHYLKTFCDNPLFYMPIPHSARTLLFLLASRIPYATEKAPLIYFGGAVADSDAEKIGLSISTVKRNLKWLVDHDLIRRRSRGVYEVNPYLYAKGPSQAVLRLQQSWGMLRRQKTPLRSLQRPKKSKIEAPQPVRDTYKLRGLFI